MAASLASVPELQKNAWPPKLRSRQGLGPVALQLGVPGVGHVDQLAQLLADRLDHRRRAMAQQIAAPAAEQIEVAVALRCPRRTSLRRATKRDGKAAVVGNHVLLEQLERFFGTHWWLADTLDSSHCNHVGSGQLRSLNSITANLAIHYL